MRLIDWKTIFEQNGTLREITDEELKHVPQASTVNFGFVYEVAEGGDKYYLDCEEALYYVSYITSRRLQDRLTKKSA